MLLPVNVVSVIAVYVNVCSVNVACVIVISANVFSTDVLAKDVHLIYSSSNLDSMFEPASNFNAIRCLRFYSQIRQRIVK